MQNLLCLVLSSSVDPKIVLMWALSVCSAWYHDL